MKPILTLFLLFSARLIFSQACIPDTTQIPANSFIFPVPYQDTVAGSGIPNKACINTHYEQVFQVKIPSTVEFLGFNVHVEQIKLNSIDGLPSGLSYACEPGGCTMLKNTIGCMKISGIPDASNAVKIYPIKLNFTFTTLEFGSLQLSFPDENIAPGLYEIDLRAEGSAECIASTDRHLIDLAHKAYQNEGSLIFDIDSRDQINADIELFDASGKKIALNRFFIEYGKNQLSMNAGKLNPGAYFYIIKTGKGFASGKLFIY